MSRIDDLMQEYGVEKTPCVDGCRSICTEECGCAKDNYLCYPEFTREKQYELIRLLSNTGDYFHIGKCKKDYFMVIGQGATEFLGSFEEAIADAVILNKDILDREEIKRILES